MIGDVRTVEEGKIVGAGLDPLEGVIGIVRVELDLAISPEQRRADRAAQIEIKAGGLPPVRRLADETRTRDAAATDDAGRFDAIDDLPRVGEGARGEREGEERRRDCALEPSFETPALRAPQDEALVSSQSHATSS